MVWINGDLTVYHGCDDASAKALCQPTGNCSHGVKISLCRALTDFGQGFYTTTSLHQAQQWANQRVRRAPRMTHPAAAVVQFSVDRSTVCHLQQLAFVMDQNDFYDLVAYCRAGGLSHARPIDPYDVVHGPVSLWPQRLVVKDCDQISFHTDGALATLSDPKVTSVGNPLF